MTIRLKIKDSICVLRNNAGEYVFLFTATRCMKTFKVDPLVEDIVDLLDNEISIEDLEANLGGKYSPDNISLCVNALEKQRIVRKYDGEILPDRFSRQLLFIDELSSSYEDALKLHRRIRNSKVVVFGVGGIGTWIVNGLYQIGVGEIHISDPDVIEFSNLNRQLFFDSRDVGDFKVDVITRKLRDANITPHKSRVSPDEDLTDILFGSDFIVNCTDNPSVAATSRIINEYALRLSIPYCISGGYNLHLGMVGPIIVPNQPPSLEDFLKYQKSIDILNGLEVIRETKQPGNLGPIAGTVANMQVMEIFKYLIGKGNLNVGRYAEIDFIDSSVTWMEVPSS